MERTLPSIIKQRIDTTANWTSKNPILLKGEIGFEITSTAEFKQKVGDGTSKWSELPYSYLTPNEMKTEIKSNQVVVPGSLNLTDNGFYVKAGSNTLMSLKADGYGVHLGTRPLMGMTINLDCHRANDTIYSLSYHGEDESNYALGWSELSAWRENDITTEITPLRILAQKIEFNPGENGKENGVILDGIATPTEGLQAVNKNYVDTLTSKYLPLTGGTLTGSLKLSASSTSTYLQFSTNNTSNTATIKSGKGGGGSADLSIIGGVNLNLQAGSAAKSITITGTGTSHGVFIKNVATPVNNTDAANKQYVDSSIASIPTYTLPIASTTTLGGIIVGDNITTTADGIISVPQLSDSAPGIIYAPEEYSGLERTDGYDTGSTLRISNAIQGRKIVFGMNSGNNYGILFGSQNSVSTGAFMRPVSTGGMIGFELLTAGYNPSSYDCEITPANTFPSLKVSIMPVAGGSIIINPNNNGTASDLMIVASSVAMSGAKISNIGAPTNATDAANKAYVDSAVSGITIEQTIINGVVAQATTSSGTTSTATASTSQPLVVTKVGKILFVSGRLYFNSILQTNTNIIIKLEAVRDSSGSQLNFKTTTNQSCGTVSIIDSSGTLLLTSVIVSGQWVNSTKSFYISFPKLSGTIPTWKVMAINLNIPMYE